MSDRFFANEPITGLRAALAGDEARHLVGVMRAETGDEVVLFDGSGAEFACRVLKVGKQQVELEIIERREVSRELSVAVTLAVALPKGERQKWLVEKATELGVTRIVPLTTQRGVAQPTDAALARLRRTVIEASKQCGRNRLLEIGSPADALQFFASAPTAALRLLAEPGAAPLGEVAARTQEIVAAVGPEGGLTPHERSAALAAGWQPVSLGPAILRVETAAIAIAAWAATADRLNAKEQGGKDAKQDADKGSSI